MADGGVYVNSNGDWVRAGGAGGGIDVESEREHQLLQGDDAKGWVPGMAMSVVDAVPADTDGEIGDVVFVTGPGDGGSSGGGLKILGIHTASANTDQQVTEVNQASFPGMFIRYTPKSGTSILQVNFVFTAFANSNNGKETALGELFLKEESTGSTVWSGAVMSENAQSNASRAVRIRQIIPLTIYCGMTEALKGTELTYQMYGRVPSTDQTNYLKVQNGSYGCQMTVMEIERG